MKNVSPTIYHSKPNKSNIFWKIFSSFVFVFFAVQIFPQNFINNDPSPYTYDELLTQSIYKMDAFEYGRAMDILSFARGKKSSPDYRYFYILGEIFFRMGRMEESFNAFDESLKLEPGQIELLLKIASYHEKDRRPNLSLSYLKKYLRFVPEDKERTYRAAILAKRSGENNYAESLFNNLENDSIYQLEKDSIIEIIRSNIQSKNWEKAIDLGKKYLMYFPREEILHEYFILAQRGKNSPDLERSIVDSAAIFSKNANFSVRYGIFLQEQGRILEALSAFRRGYRISLNRKEDPIAQAEILFLIRQTYTILKRNHDARGISHLDNLIRSDRIVDEDSIVQSIKTYPKNREILEFSLNYYRSINRTELANQMEKNLHSRDVEHEETELVFVIGPFVKEILTSR